MNMYSETNHINCVPVWVLMVKKRVPAEVNTHHLMSLWMRVDDSECDRSYKLTHEGWGASKGVYKLNNNAFPLVLVLLYSAYQTCKLCAVGAGKGTRMGQGRRKYCVC